MNFFRSSMINAKNLKVIYSRTKRRNEITEEETNGVILCQNVSNACTFGVERAN